MNQFDFFVDLPKFDSAKCADIEDKDLFFPDNRTQEAERLHQLKAICASCIHSKECLEYALEKQIPYGVWGGSTPADRDTVARTKGDKPALRGMVLKITQMHAKGVSANEIAATLHTSPGYVRRIIKKHVATEQGAAPLHQQTKNSSEGSH